MLTRLTTRFRSAVEAAEAYCWEIGLEVDPAIVDEVARTWVSQVARQMGVTDRTALAYAPPDFGRLIADSIVQDQRRRQLELRPFGRDAVVYTSAPSAGAVCCRCDRSIDSEAQAASVLNLHGRRLAHPDCI